MKVLRRKFKNNEFGENIEGSEEKVIEEINVAGYRELIEFEKMLANISGQTLNVRYDKYIKDFIDGFVDKLKLRVKI